MLWLFLLLGLIGSPFGMLMGYSFFACMVWAGGAYALSMAAGGISALVTTRRIIFPLLDLAIFAVVVGIGFFFGETPHPYLLFAVIVLLYTVMVILAFHLYCRHYGLGYVEMLKTEARYAAKWIQTDMLA